VSTTQYRKLSGHEQFIVAVGVLIDGSDAAQYVRLDSKRGELLAEAATELAQLDLSFRLPFVGTLVRVGLESDE
jgi:hypothetical protein